MTIALSVKVHDGLVLATDSATTLVASNGDGGVTVQNVYNSGNKLFNLMKGWPIGATTWGAGSIGAVSIATLAKDLRRRFGGLDPSCPGWQLDRSTYTVEMVAEYAKAFLYDELYAECHRGKAEREAPPLGFCVAGYSAGAPLPEIWVIEMGGGKHPEPRCVAPQDNCCIDPHGEPEAIHRLIAGCGLRLGDALRDLGVPEDQVMPAVNSIRAKLEVPLLAAPMPIQDAIDLARYLVETTIGFIRFVPGASTVGGPVDIAAITKHEGFRWVQRKLYYDRHLNPREDT